MCFKLFLVISSLFIWGGSNFSYTNRRKEISSIAGTIGQLPCYVEAVEDVAMILWFKEPSGSPIYSFDGRNENEPPRHLPTKSELGLRLHFRIPSKMSSSSMIRPPALLIRSLKPSDSGLYRCRIDYRDAPTTNYVILLKVIQPPTRLEIQYAAESRPISDQQIQSNVKQDSDSIQNDITFMGPYIEGQNVSIVCTAFGGTPLPQVTWYRDGSLIDWTYDVVNSSVTNELSIYFLKRNHSHKLYTCEASNNNYTKPISHRVNLDVYSTVKEIDVEVPDQMTAGAQYSLLCRTKGSYPAVKLEFWKAYKRLGARYQTKSNEDSVAVHTILFTPEVDDNEAFVTCKADNPWIRRNFMETGRKLNVLYPPIVILRFGSSKRENFSEGESVLLECHTKANPQMNSITWFHQGEQLFESVTAGIHMNGMTLVLHYLSHTSGGNYVCEVTNLIGKGVSNSLQLKINISPKCSSRNERVIPLAVGESRQLQCSILAWPPDLNFYWTFNRSGGILPMSNVGQIIRRNLSKNESDLSLSHSDYLLRDEMLSRLESRNPNASLHQFQHEENFGRDTTKNSKSGKRQNDDIDFYRIFHQSLLPYQVNSETDYGFVGCWAKNSYGKQIFPCLFRIVPREPLNHISEKGMRNSTTELEMKGNVKEEDRILVKKGTGIFFGKLHPTFTLTLSGLLIFIAASCLIVCCFSCFCVNNVTKS